MFSLLEKSSANPKFKREKNNLTLQFSVRNFGNILKFEEKILIVL
jgi:hypothetical protein